MRQKRRAFVNVILVAGCLCVTFAGCRDREAEDRTEEIFSSVSEESVHAEAGEADTVEDVSGGIFIYVCGQVKAPGVYEFSKGSRVADALFAAGGMTEQAAKEYLNQAAPLEDGQKVYVPSEEEIEESLQQGMEPDGSVAGSERAGTSETGNGGRVNLNTAGKAELMTLSGIGESRAEAILAYRQEHGKFKSIEDIKKIEGIKEGIFSRIKDRLTV